MVSKQLKILNQAGLHLRPAMLLSQTMAQFPAEATVHYHGKQLDAKSILSLMTGGIPGGAEVLLTCSGEEETAMLSAAEALIADRFGEM
ncbi:MAG: HPr family phosphocarrier protein [Eubacterium sp.]|nr:HPr family phosphocarrier protein [Eubacterium sp.]